MISFPPHFLTCIQIASFSSIPHFSLSLPSCFNFRNLNLEEATADHCTNPAQLMFVLKALRHVPRLGMVFKSHHQVSLSLFFHVQSVNLVVLPLLTPLLETGTDYDTFVSVSSWMGTIVIKMGVTSKYLTCFK